MRRRLHCWKQFFIACFPTTARFQRLSFLSGFIFITKFPVCFIVVSCTKYMPTCTVERRTLIRCRCCEPHGAICEWQCQAGGLSAFVFLACRKRFPCISFWRNPLSRNFSTTNKPPKGRLLKSFTALCLLVGSYVAVCDRIAAGNFP